MMAGGSIVYDFDGHNQAIANSGMVSIHQLAARSGLIDEINTRINLLKRHLPHHESDHILNIASSYLAGGSCFQDIELLRNDTAWLNALGAEITADPTTAGDFLRRFNKNDFEFRHFFFTNLYILSIKFIWVHFKKLGSAR
jgi:hypothetical protein